MSIKNQIPQLCVVFQTEINIQACNIKIQLLQLVQVSESMIINIGVKRIC